MGRGSIAVKGVVGKIVDRGADSSFLPTGTVTLLLGDIEGSTRLWQAPGSDMLALIAIFNDTVGKVVGDHGGVRPLEQGEGDSFVAAFDRGSDALRCAVDLQAADLGPLRLRIGVHTGEVHRRDPANYAGVSLSRCARLRDLGHGGQVLMSRACYAVVADDAPAEVEFRDLGVHRLRDLARPEHVYQLCHPQLRSEFPPLRSADHPRHNLPVPRTRLVGRGLAGGRGGQAGRGEIRDHPDRIGRMRQDPAGARGGGQGARFSRPQGLFRRPFAADERRRPNQGAGRNLGGPGGAGPSR